MIKRSQWGAKPLTEYSNSIKPELRSQVVIHHSVTGEGKTQAEVESILRGIDGFHRGKGWGGIGYNLAVDYAGRVYEARGIDIQGAHAYGANTNGYGIVYIGDGRKGVTFEAVQAIRTLVIELQTRSLKKLKVVGHNQVNKTACPGTHLEAELKKGTFEVAYPLSAPTPPPVSPLPSSAPQAEYTVAFPGDSYWKIALRVLKVSNTPSNYPAIIKESNRIQNLNNKQPLFAGQRVKISEGASPVSAPAPSIKAPEGNNIVILPNDSYWRIAVRVLKVSNTPNNYAAIIKESNRIQNLNNKKSLIPGQSVRIS
jgi:hypothetical protein